jgi:hypothetical protein
MMPGCDADRAASVDDAYLKVDGARADDQI